MGGASENPRVVEIGGDVRLFQVTGDPLGITLPKKKVLVKTTPCVAVIGMSAAGKSTLFDILPEALIEYGCTFKRGPLTAKYLSEGKFPPPTQHDTSAESYVHRAEDFLVEMPSGSGASREVRLKIVDPPGQIFEDQEQTKRYADEFRECTGILILFSPFDIKNFTKIEESTRLFMNQIEERTNQSLERVAFAVSQADAIPWIGRIRPKCAKAWLLGHEKIRPLLKAHASADDRAYFFISSIGWFNGHPNLVTTDLPRRLGETRVQNETLRRPGDFPDVGLLEAPDIEHSPLKVKEEAERKRRINGRRRMQPIAERAPEVSASEEESPASDMGDSPLVEPGAAMLNKQFPGFTDPAGVVSMKGYQDPELGLERGKTHVIPGRPLHQQNDHIYKPWNLIEALCHVAGIT